MSSWQSQPSQCCSCQQSGEPRASPLRFLALPPPHSSPLQHAARWEHKAFPRAWSAVSPTCFFFAGDIKYDEAMGYPMVQHWRVRSNLYRVKLSSITLSAGEGFQGQGDVCLHGWVMIFCPKHPTDISHPRALFPALRQAGRFPSFFTGGKLRQGVCAARGEVKARRKPVSNEQEGFVLGWLSVCVCTKTSQSLKKRWFQKEPKHLEKQVI